MARAMLILALLFSLVEALPADDAVWTGVERIVAVGDVHGDYGQLVAVLRSAGVIDEKTDWIGGRTHLVQTGDVPDRGPGTRKILELLQKLQKQAKKAKGMVHPLIGNHEAMNVYGDLRYTTPEEFAAFKSPRSDEYRERYYDLHVEEVKQKTSSGKLPAFDAAYRERWMSNHPPGYFEQRLAFAPDGEFGKWITHNEAMIRINDMLFLHGGLSPKYAATPIDQLNKAVRDALQGKAPLEGSAAIDGEGPLWYRGMAQHHEEVEAPNVDAALAAHGVKHIVIGHTPTMGTVIPRFGGKVILIDVGLSAYYGARQACLVVEKGELFTIHRGTKLKLPVSGDSDDLLRYLEQAAALDPAPSPLAPMIDELRAKSPVAR